MIGLYDGLIVTMNHKREILKDSALIIKDNIIWDLGDIKEIRKKYAREEVEWISCWGRVLFPGFINCHIHAAQSIVRGVAEDMGRAPSYTSSVPQGDDLSDEESYIFSLLGAAGAMRFGSTLIGDNYAHAMVSSKAFKTLGIRAIVSERVHDMDFHGLGRKIYQRDEALGERLLDKNIELLETLGTDRNHLVTACLGPHAPDTCSRELLLKIGELSEKYPGRVTTHLAQSQMELDYVREIYHMSPVEHMEACGLLNQQLLAAHGVFLNEKDMGYLARKGVHLIHIPEGNAKAGAIAAVSRMRAMGINTAIGTDNGAANMIENMRMALVAGRIYNHSVTDPRPEEILEMVTVNAAKALGMEEKIGSLEKGKKADVVIINYNQFHLTPCTNVIGSLVHLALGNDVETVYIDGKKTVEKGHVVGLDEVKLMREARRIGQIRWQQANAQLDRKKMYVF